MKSVDKIVGNTKFCSKCKNFLSFDNFSKSKLGINGLSSHCKGCIKLKNNCSKYDSERFKVYYQKNKQRLRDYANAQNHKLTGNNLPFGKEYQLKNYYNLSPDDYFKIVEKQNNLCAICKKPETVKTNKGDRIRGLAIDHCHTTGKVRGLLCSKCNKAIGLLKDNIELLESAIEYLKNN